MGFGEKGFAELGRGEKEDLPFNGVSFRHEVKINGIPYLINIGEYEDGRPGDVVINSYSAGSDIGELLRTSGIAASKALKRGVPLEVAVGPWIGPKGNLGGFVTIDTNEEVKSHPHIKQVNSPLDFAGRLMLLNYLGQTDLATKDVEVKIEDLRGFKNGAFRTYERMNINPWNVDHVLADPELGGFESMEDINEGLPKVNKEEIKDNKNNNTRGISCDKCGHMMRQTAPGCFDCTNCHEKIGGCGM